MNVKRYNKGIGAIVGGVVGVVLVILGVTEDSAITEDWAPIVAAVTAAITALVGTVLSPKNHD